MARQVVGSRVDSRRPRGTPVARTPAGRGGATAVSRDGGAVRSRRLIVLGVLGVLCTVTLAPHVRLYVEQERYQSEVRADIAEREAAVADLQRQGELWRDDAFVAAQARERLNYAFPGETSYVVAPELLAGEQLADASGGVGAAGGAGAGDTAGVSGPAGRGGGAVQPWYRELWDGFGAAGEAVTGESAPAEPAGIPAG